MAAPRPSGATDREEEPGPSAGPEDAATVLGDLDHYAVLGVPRTASTDDIRRAYRTLAQVLHPDKHPRRGIIGGAEQRATAAVTESCCFDRPNPSLSINLSRPRSADPAVRAHAARLFAALAEAHAVLSVPRRRAVYDEAGPDARQLLRDTGTDLATWDGRAADLRARLAEARRRRAAGGRLGPSVAGGAPDVSHSTTVHLDARGCWPRPPRGVLDWVSGVGPVPTANDHGAAIAEGDEDGGSSSNQRKVQEDEGEEEEEEDEDDDENGDDDEDDDDSDEWIEPPPPGRDPGAGRWRVPAPRGLVVATQARLRLSPTIELGAGTQVVTQTKRVRSVRGAGRASGASVGLPLGQGNVTGSLDWACGLRFLDHVRAEATLASFSRSAARAGLGRGMGRQGGGRSAWAALDAVSAQAVLSKNVGPRTQAVVQAGVGFDSTSVAASYGAAADRDEGATATSSLPLSDPFPAVVPSLAAHLTRASPLGPEGASRLDTGLSVTVAPRPTAAVTVRRAGRHGRSASARFEVAPLQSTVSLSFAAKAGWGGGAGILGGWHGGLVPAWARSWVLPWLGLAGAGAARAENGSSVDDDDNADSKVGSTAPALGEVGVKVRATLVAALVALAPGGTLPPAVVQMAAAGAAVTATEANEAGEATEALVTAVGLESFEAWISRRWRNSTAKRRGGGGDDASWGTGDGHEADEGDVDDDGDGDEATATKATTTHRVKLVGGLGPGSSLVATATHHHGGHKFEVPVVVWSAPAGLGPGDDADADRDAVAALAVALAPPIIAAVSWLLIGAPIRRGIASRRRAVARRAASQQAAAVASLVAPAAIRRAGLRAAARRGAVVLRAVVRLDEATGTEVDVTRALQLADPACDSQVVVASVWGVSGVEAGRLDVIWVAFGPDGAVRFRRVRGHSPTEGWRLQGWEGGGEDGTTEEGPGGQAEALLAELLAAAEAS